MKRDADLLRELLFKLEQERDYVSHVDVDKDSSDQGRVEYGHLLLLDDDGLIELSGRYRNTVRITNRGHDFIAAVRSESIWAKAKAAASNAGTATVSMLFEVALAYGKRELKQATGIDLP
ncbi:DUF2513 domain-containing protein [Roseibaca calidilacus]|uniref:DUF2513 domain-containing protein n=1 Tax=Roseibaca calidilacus TaxID=1666912 RepID=UPI0009304527|nr:DUF2513 domain-containing protein [Roseibaca calidilacus]